MTAATAIVLAAGKGTRMKSALPKVLFPVLGRPMIHWVLDALESVGIRKKIVVVGYEADLVKQELANRSGVSFALQAQQLGTGHAVQMCRDQIAVDPGPILVLAGDSPLVQADSLKQLLARFTEGNYDCLLGTLEKQNPHGLGRIVRNKHGKFERIVEEKDATAEEKLIREVNMSTYLFKSPALLNSLSKLSNGNAQGEFYLTDCPAILISEGGNVDAAPVLKPCEALSINTVEEAALVEQQMKELGYRCEN